MTKLTAEIVEFLAALHRCPGADDRVVERHFDELYEYFTENGEMPYGTAKARDGDPYQWIANKLESMK